MAKRGFELDLQPLRAGRPKKNRELRMADGNILLEKEEYKALVDRTNLLQQLNKKDNDKKTSKP